MRACATRQLSDIGADGASGGIVRLVLLLLVIAEPRFHLCTEPTMNSYGGGVNGLVMRA